MTYHYIFPTCVYSDDQESLAKTILPVCEEYLEKYGEIFTTNTSHISTYRNATANAEMMKDIRLKPLLDYIIENSLKFLEYQNVDPSQFEKSIRSNQIFLINKVTKGGSHTRHAHPAAVISGCFYLKCSEISSPLIFTDPREYYKYINYPQAHNTERHSCLYADFIVPVKQGLILLWPSWLEHEVPHSTDDNERITIAFNLGSIS
jgi:uncharacterized protein (TIGR02466 family)